MKVYILEERILVGIQTGIQSSAFIHWSIPLDLGQQSKNQVVALLSANLH